jgi:hypothetical protein
MRKNDRDDIDKDVRHLQDIMARYSIPASIPFDQIASPECGTTLTRRCRWLHLGFTASSVKPRTHKSHGVVYRPRRPRSTEVRAVGQFECYPHRTSSQPMA